MKKLAWVPIVLAALAGVKTASANPFAYSPYGVVPVGGMAPPAMLPTPTTVPSPMPPAAQPMVPSAPSAAPIPYLPSIPTVPGVPGQPNGCAPESMLVDMGTCSEECYERCGRILAGGGVYFVKPYFQTDPAISFFRQGTGPGYRLDVRHKMVEAPQGWIGWMNDDGFGIRAKYWYLREGTSQEYILPPPSSPVLTVLSAAPMGAVIIQNDPRAFAVTSKLELQVADFEVVQQFDLCKWDLLLAFGVARVDITQSYNAYAINTAGNGVRPLSADSRFLGVGPVLALEIRRPICDTCFNLYGSTRSRLLYGSAKHNAYGGDELNGFAKNVQETVIGIQELELGAEYVYEVGAARFFSQAALVGQQWFGGSNASRSARGGPPTTIPNFSTEDNSDFGLFGLSLRMGVNY